MTTLGPSTTPGTYEFQVLDLLHDPNNNRWTQAQIDSYINDARTQLVMDTGCLRTLQTGVTTQGVEQYAYGQVTGAVIVSGGANYTAPTISFSGGGGAGVAATLGVAGGAVNSITFTNFGSGYTSAPSYLISDATGSGAVLTVGALSANTYDMLAVNLFWGTQRYSLQWRPFRVFSAWFRPFSTGAYQRQPACWSMYGDTSIFLGPTPDQSYVTEWDSAILPTAFAVGDTTTVDTIPKMVQTPIAMYAAYLAKKNSQNYGEAEQHLQDYRRRLQEVVGYYTGRVPDIYQEG